MLPKCTGNRDYFPEDLTLCRLSSTFLLMQSDDVTSSKLRLVPPPHGRIVFFGRNHIGRIKITENTIQAASFHHFLASRVRVMFSRHVFGVSAPAQCFPGAFFGISRVRVAFLGRICAFGVCVMPPRGVYCARACAQCSAGAVSAFPRLREPSPRRSRAFRICAALSWHIFMFCAHPFWSIKIKIIRKGELLWQKLRSLAANPCV